MGVRGTGGQSQLHTMNRRVTQLLSLLSTFAFLSRQLRNDDLTKVRFSLLLSFIWKEFRKLLWCGAQLIRI